MKMYSLLLLIIQISAKTNDYDQYNQNQIQAKTAYDEGAIQVDDLIAATNDEANDKTINLGQDLIELHSGRIRKLKEELKLNPSQAKKEELHNLVYKMNQLKKNAYEDDSNNTKNENENVQGDLIENWFTDTNEQQNNPNKINTNNPKPSTPLQPDDSIIAIDKNHQSDDNELANELMTEMKSDNQEQHQSQSVRNYIQTENFQDSNNENLNSLPDEEIIDDNIEVIEQRVEKKVISDEQVDDINEQDNVVNDSEYGRVNMVEEQSEEQVDEQVDTNLNNDPVDDSVENEADEGVEEDYTEEQENEQFDQFLAEQEERRNKIDDVKEPIAAMKTGEEAEIAEQKSSNKIFFILSILGLSIMVIHLLIKFNLHYFPESLVVMLLGMAIGYLLNNTRDDNWLEAEFLHPETFFLLLLPPIILEAGYNLNKITFFSNFGTILVYAVFGTIISSIIVGVGIYLISIGATNYSLTKMEAAAYGSLISAVDPVATIAIFSAMKVDPTLNMLIFGESIMNDAVSIVLTSLFQRAAEWKSDESFMEKCISEFFKMFFGSAFLGTATAIITALILKHIDLRKTPSLELGLMLIFSYIPYGLAEASQLSGIMALLFSGIVMSHYAHHNLSLVTQINLQHTLRTLAFLAETSVFAYIGMAMFSFEHDVQPSFCAGSIILILLARAFNIYPLSYIVNKFRDSDQKINSRMQFVMWFSGLRGAIAYVLSLHLKVGNTQIRRIVITGTLSCVIFTIVVLGGSTYPLIKFLKITGPGDEASRKNKRAKKKIKNADNHVTLSKVENASSMLASDVYNSSYNGSDSESDDYDGSKSGVEEYPLLAATSNFANVKNTAINVQSEYDSQAEDSQTTMSSARSRTQSIRSASNLRKRSNRKIQDNGQTLVTDTFRGAFAKIDSRILIPFLCRKVTREELISNRTQMRQFASKWYDEVKYQKKLRKASLGEEIKLGDVVFSFKGDNSKSSRDKRRKFNKYVKVSEWSDEF